MKDNLVDLVIGIFIHIGIRIEDGTQFILLVASLLTLVMWIFFAKKVNSSDKANKYLTLSRNLRSWFIWISCILFLRTSVVEPFNVNESDLKPELKSYHLTVVKKWPWGLKLPVLGRVLKSREPILDEIIKARFYHDDEMTSRFGRVFGLSGERVVVDLGSCEILRNGVFHTKLKGHSVTDNKREYIIPENSILLGYDSCGFDNSDFEEMSEFIGFDVISKEDIEGSVWFQFRLPK